MPDEHMAQLQGAMWITGRAWWDFVSYDPRMPKNLQIYIQRIERNDIFIAGLDTEVRSFLAEVDSTVDQLTRRTAA
jgi:pantothenate kinase